MRSHSDAAPAGPVSIAADDDTGGALTRPCAIIAEPSAASSSNQPAALNPRESTDAALNRTAITATAAIQPTRAVAAMNRSLATSRSTA